MGFWPNREKVCINKGFFLAKSIFKIGQKPTFFGHKRNFQNSAHFLPKTKLGFAHFFSQNWPQNLCLFSAIIKHNFQLFRLRQKVSKRRNVHHHISPISTFILEYPTVFHLNKNFIHLSF